MFDTLTESFTSAIRKIRFHDDEKSLTKATGELKKALLKADVNHKIVREILSKRLSLKQKHLVLEKISFFKHFVKVYMLSWK